MIHSFRFRVIASVLVFFCTAGRFVGVVIFVHVWWILCRTGRAIHALDGRVSFFAYLGSEGLYYERRTTDSGPRTELFIFFFQAGSDAGDALCRFRAPCRWARVACVGSEIRDEWFVEGDRF